MAQPGAAGRREFYIVSEMNGKVVDIKGAVMKAGAEVIMYKKMTPAQKNQLFYLDQNNYVRNAMNDTVFYNDSKGKELKTEIYTGDPVSQWKIEGNKIVNNKGWCLDIRGAKNSDGAEVVAYDYDDKKNQHWRIEHV